MSAKHPTPTTELDAVNQMLRAIGETPVSSLAESEGLDVPVATATLEEINIAVQLEGWDFNTEHDYPFTRNAEGEITVPRNALNIDFDYRRTGDTQPVQRGLRLYDRKNHTYKFETNPRGTVILALPFEELPQAARYYITYRACRKLQDTEVGSSELHRYNATDESRARASFLQLHTDDQDLNMIRDTPEFAHLKGGW